jgi:hypothetical protein
MTRRFARSVTAAVLSTAAFAAEGYAQSSPIEIEEDTPIYLVGCIQRESDYRRQQRIGKGGFLGTGAGDGDEYVLVNASRGSDGTTGDCAAAADGDAYELTGSGESDLEGFIGQRVAISGMLKEADIDPATGRPTGGNDPAGRDLRLFEVEVKSASALGPVAESTLALSEPDRGPVGTSQLQDERGVAVQEPAPVADEGNEVSDDQLPRTASPLVLTGLLGLLSFGGAAGLRALYRRERGTHR